MTKAAVHVFVSGKVQGVFYRQSTLEKAETLGGSGWVKNLADGRVEALLVGESEVLETMLAWMEVGPPAAVVEGIEVQVEEGSNNLDSFTIK